MLWRVLLLLVIFLVVPETKRSYSFSRIRLSLHIIETMTFTQDWWILHPLLQSIIPCLYPFSAGQTSILLLLCKRWLFLVPWEQFMGRVFHIIFSYNVLVRQWEIMRKLILKVSWSFDLRRPLPMRICSLSWRHHWLFLYIFRTLTTLKSWTWRLILKSSNSDRWSHRLSLYELSYAFLFHSKLFDTSWRLIFSTAQMPTITRPILFLNNFMVFPDDILSIELIKVDHQMIDFLLPLMFF